MVVVHPKPIEGLSSYSTIHRPCPPFLVLEYVSKSSKQKDYEDNFQKYAHELKVPYYLLYDLDENELYLYRLIEDGYQPLERNANGRVAVPELELEAAIHDVCVRYWFRGELLPLPAEILQELEAEKQHRSSVESALEVEKQRRSSIESALEAEQHRRSNVESALEAEQHRRSNVERRWKRNSIVGRTSRARWKRNSRRNAEREEMLRLREELAAFKKKD